MSTRKTEANLEVLAKARQALGLRVDVDQMQRLIATSAKNSQPNQLKFLMALAAMERQERDDRNLARRTTTACLPPFTTLDKFDWNHPKSIDRGCYNSLLELEFVRTGENVLLRGPSGVGKSTLAANLAWTALQTGHTVQFTTLTNALADLLRQESLPAFERRKKRYTTPALLVIDELGYLPCDNHSADILYAIIADRHEKAATVITTNLSFKQWPEVFPGAACVGALVDRFIQHCHVIDINAESWRRKMAQQKQKAKRTAPAARPKAKR